MKWLPALVLAALGCGGSEPANADPTKSAATVETPAPPRLPDAEDILEAHVEAIGGRAAIEAIEHLYLESEVESATRNVTGHARMWWSQGKYYVEMEIEGHGVSMAGYDGARAWRLGHADTLRSLLVRLPQ